MTLDLAGLWDSTTVDSPDGGVDPPVGSYQAEVAVAKRGVAKSSSRPYLVVEFKTDAYQWTEFKWLDTQGQVKSAKILLSQLGLDGIGFDQLDAALAGIVGDRYQVAVIAGPMNPTTGVPYLNTEVGQKLAAAPVAAAPAGVPVASFDGPAAPAVPVAATEEVPF